MDKKKEDEEELKMLPDLKPVEFTIDEIKNLSISELYHKVKLPNKILQDIYKQGDEKVEAWFKERFKLNEDIEKEQDTRDKIKVAFYNIQDLLRKYLDIEEGYYTLIPLWIIGTYIHKEFPSYPFLYFNATRGSGKTRVMKLISFLSYEGAMLNSLTEAVLFRTKGMLAIDEFEGISRKGTENLRELLNSAYKKGIKVKRMRKVRTPEGENQVVEEFDVYRPICMANICGIEEVLSDRCITLVLEKSSKSRVVSLVELFEYEELGLTAKKILYEQRCSLCSVVTMYNVYKEWNNYIYSITNNYISTGAQNNTILHYFNKIKEMGLDGRSLELAFPLLIIASLIDTKIFNLTLSIIEEIMKEKKDNFSLESKDVSFVDFVSQYTKLEEFVPIMVLALDFRAFLQEDEGEEKWLNTKWVGRALKRLGLIKVKRRLSRGIEVILNIPKAQEKIKMFK